MSVKICFKINLFLKYVVWPENSILITGETRKKSLYKYVNKMLWFVCVWFAFAVIT